MYESDKSKDSLFFDENNLRIVGLDIVRTIAIFFVISVHYFKNTIFYIYSKIYY